MRGVGRVDVNQIDGVSAILGALAASASGGALDGIKDLTKDAVLGVRDKFVTLVRDRLKKDALGEAKLIVYVAEPTPTSAEALRGHIVKAGLDRDEEILALARQVLRDGGALATGSGSVAAAVITATSTHGGHTHIGGIITYGTPPISLDPH